MMYQVFIMKLFYATIDQFSEIIMKDDDAGKCLAKRLEILKKVCH